MNSTPQQKTELNSISVVVPVYRSAKTLEELHGRLTAVLSNVVAQWEVVFVDDASPDEVWERITSLRAKDAHVKGVKLAFNHGQQRATLCGIQHARYQVIVTIDDDLQCRPEDIPMLVAALRDGAYAVFARFKKGDRKQEGWRMAGSHLNQWLAGKILSKPDELQISSFRAIRGVIAKKMLLYKGVHPHISALVLRSTPANRLRNVEVEHNRRADGGKSNYSLFKLLQTLSLLLINHSYIPLRFLSWWGFLISIGSVLYAVSIFVRTMAYGSVQQGWPSTIVLVSFLSGNILLALGIIGEYVGRLVEQSSMIEQFTVFEETD